MPTLISRKPANSRQILDQHGRPLSSARRRPTPIAARYDAAQTWVGNEKHWQNVDTLDPHAAASYSVRSKLRVRSRYEILENNPYLKGTILTVANDFTGRGPRLQITDKRISPQRRQQIEMRFSKWASQTKLRQKLWRLRTAKIVDGEAFARAYTDRNLRGPVKLNFQVLEADRVSSPDNQQDQPGEIDGVRFDAFESPTQYHILDSHPGSNLAWRYSANARSGQWVDAAYIIHWYRQDRGWLRGIPELTPSLPLCAVLRRYTLSKLRHSETAADMTLVIESEGPAGSDVFNTEDEDSPFETFPFEQGLINLMPWGYKAKQLDAVAPGDMYDQYVGSLLREVIRPILVPYNIAAGTSKDSNMASSIVDRDMYRSGQKAERTHAEEEVLCKVASLWWYEAVRVPNYLGDDLLSTDPMFREELPDHCWRWDQINTDHTDPQKVWGALKTAHDKRFLTDRDVQEIYFNRDVEQWQEEVRADEAFRSTLIAMGFDAPPEMDQEGQAPEQFDEQK